MTRACVHPVGPTRLTQVPKRALTELGPLSYSVLRTLSRQAAFPSPQRKRQCRPWILTRSARGCVDVGDAPTNALARHSKTPACYITTWAPGEAGGRARHFVFQVHPWEKAADWTARSRNKTRSCVRRTKRRQLLRHDCSSNRVNRPWSIQLRRKVDDLSFVLNLLATVTLIGLPLLAPRDNAGTHVREQPGDMMPVRDGSSVARTSPALVVTASEKSYVNEPLPLGMCSTTIPARKPSL